jgi:ABC-type Zn uptake system ZnuABC Zn-binding protein ZnuA
MSKKHYIQVAKIIRAAIVHKHPQPADIIAHNLAEIFEQENPRFDRSRFLEACSVNH